MKQIVDDIIDWSLIIALMFIPAITAYFAFWE